MSLDPRIQRTAAPRMFVYCDDASHPARRGVVGNYLFVGPGWTEVSMNPLRRGTPVDSGTTIKPDDTPLTDEEALNLSELMAVTPRPVMRSRYQLVCRKCKGRGVPARQENLFAAFDRVSAEGVSELSLSTLAAILARQSNENADRPEPRQG